jgi:hypothetical protein
MKRLVAVLLVLAAAGVASACEPTPAVVNPIPPAVDAVSRVIDFFFGQEKNPDPPSGDGQWHTRKVNCAVVAHNEQVNSAGIMPVTPIDGYAFFFPEQWYKECFPFRPSTVPAHTAVPTTKGSGAWNFPSMTPTIQCAMRTPFVFSALTTIFECSITSNPYWFPQARTDPAFLQVVAS